MTAVIALCAAYAAYCLFTNPAGPITTPDSVHYLNMTPIVPLGYPFFLKLTGARGAIIAQPIMYSAALAVLGREIVRGTRSIWLAMAVVAGCMVVPQIREYHASILSESLFLSLLVLLLALSVRFVYHPTPRQMALIAIVVGASALVRRTGFAFVAVMLAMALLQRRQLRMSMLFVAALSPFAVITGLEQAIAPVVHAGAASSLLGRHMFAKAALIDAAPAHGSGDDPVRRALDAQLETHLAPIREMLARAPDHVRGVLTLYYETCLQGGCADEARALTGEPTEARQTAVLGAAGLARIRRAPLNFLKLVWRDYRSLWTVNRLRHPDTAPALNAFLAAHRPLPYEHYALALGPDRTLTFEPSATVRYAQFAATAVALVTGTLALGGLAAAAAGLPLSPPLAAASVSALTAHAGLVLTALLAAGFSRFLLGLWPALVVAGAFAGFALKSKIKS
jgi:hypothetical protein